MHRPVPMSSLNLPASHCVHSPAPGASLYVPAWHAVHGPPCGPEKPMLHTQSLTESLPSSACESSGQAKHCPGPALSLYLPASQASQAALPVDSLNLPSSHAVQGPPSGPVCPGVQGCATGTGRSGSGSTICDTLSVVSFPLVLRFRERWEVRDDARDACFASMSPTHVCVCELSED